MQFRKLEIKQQNKLKKKGRAETNERNKQTNVKKC